jgi:cell division septation protein DedD
MKRALLILVVAGFTVVPLSAQTADEDIRAAIRKIDNGQFEEVRKELPDLAAKYQNNAGIMYLQGRLASDGIEAVKFYQSVVDNFPRSEWADDALYRIYQYYYSLGLYRTAELKMQQLRKEYPDSPYLNGDTGDVKLPVKEEKPVNLPSRESVTLTPPETKEEKNPTAAPPQAASQPYTLQVGAFSTLSNAEKQKTFFEERGFTVEVTNKIRAGRSLYLVWVGSFATAEQARQFGKEVKTKYNIDSIIVERY